MGVFAQLVRTKIPLGCSFKQSVVMDTCLLKWVNLNILYKNKHSIALTNVKMPLEISSGGKYSPLMEKLISDRDVMFRAE